VSRAERLLDLIHTVRRRRYPISGAALADELGISLRTVYRDIETQRAQGARIDGEPGLGYILRPGFLLPPLMFVDLRRRAMLIMDVSLSLLPVWGRRLNHHAPTLSAARQSFANC
jgi:predicted DNA-binding transcriptional regulator YafY